MPKFATDSKWLKHSDLEEGRDHLVTIESFQLENLAPLGEAKQEKYVLYLKEFDKGFALNRTNGKVLCKLFQTDELTEWIGKQCLLYVKEDVEFQGDIVSAIRVRPKLPGAQQSKPRLGLTMPEPGPPGVPQTGAATDIMNKIPLLESLSEAMGLFKEMGQHQEMSREDRMMLTEMLTQRMQELT